MRAGQHRFPGIVGFDQSVLPHVERPLVAGHDIILLGERGQGKTRLIRTMSGLLDDWTPAVKGCEINDHCCPWRVRQLAKAIHALEIHAG